MPTLNPKLHPIRFEVIRNALVEATEEMTIALRRSAYSTNIKTRADFSCAFFDHKLQPVAQAFTQPVHLGSLSQLVPRVITEYGPENLAPGDAILSNDPYLGGVHLNDITLISPVYYDDTLLGYVANLAHHVDVGGGAPASIGAFREVYQEGVIIPAVKLVREGESDDDIFRLQVAVDDERVDVSDNYAFEAPFKRYMPPLLSRKSWSLRRSILRGVDGDYFAYTGDKAEGVMLRLYRLHPMVGKRRPLSAASVKDRLYEAACGGTDSWEDDVPREVAEIIRGEWGTVRRFADAPDSTIRVAGMKFPRAGW